jgi:hypothetical protein
VDDLHRRVAAFPLPLLRFLLDKEAPVARQQPIAV